MFKSLKVKIDKNTQAFFALVKVGLWELADANLPLNDKVDWEKVYQLAEEQSVVGLVLAGIDHSYVKPPQEFLLQWIGEVQMLEQQNKAMNQFIAELVERLRKTDIYTLLVKGQGIAQCYERPLWRASGDVDLFLSETNFRKADKILSSFASQIEEEKVYYKHKAMNIEDWTVELHGTLHSGLWGRIDRSLDEIQNSVFCDGNVRSWLNGKTQVFLPGADEDVVYVFSHVLQHFYKEGIGLRQICDWCRLLWTYRSKLDLRLLESRIRRMGLMSEWKAFAALAVDYLGMPVEAMPFYSSSKKWSKKASRIMEFVLETGNFGHNRDYSYFEKYPYIVFKTISFWKHIKDSVRYFKIFPLNSVKVLARRIMVGFSVVIRGKRGE